MGNINNYHLDFIHRWLRYKDYVNLSAVLKNHSLVNVVIYGGGGVGKLLFEYLHQTDISVKCVIDQNPDLDFPYDVDVLSPEQFHTAGIEVDVIIVTALSHFWAIKDYFAPLIDCELISLEELIVDIDILHNFYNAVEHIEKSGALLYLFDITQPILSMKNPSVMELIHIIHNTNALNYFGFNGIKTELLEHFYNDLPNYDEEYLNNVFKVYPSIEKNEMVYVKDVESKYFNVISGIRYTSDNPKIYDNTINFFGNCCSIGIRTEDSLTVESQLQRALNSAPLHNKSYRVINHSGALPAESHKYFRRILDTELHEGDIVILLHNSFPISSLRFYTNSYAVQYRNIVSAFDRPHDMGEVFLDCFHTNHRGYKLLADKIYEVLYEPFIGTNKKVKNEVLQRKFVPYKAKKQINPTLKNYVSFLCGEKESCPGVVGAIVMNCNPFTLGHKYLIEQAKNQCDYLYVFIVEEDKSFFSFKDRFSLAKSGTKNMTNVKILPAGEFIISAKTFPEYFMKEFNPNLKVDASKDIGVFANDIAPVLNITKRFVGEEPFDHITEQYNQALLETLPRYGISVIVIPRKQTEDGIPISASNVRKLLKRQDFQKISEMVPEATLEYLTKWYGDNYAVFSK